MRFLLYFITFFLMWLLFASCAKEGDVYTSFECEMATKTVRYTMEKDIDYEIWAYDDEHQFQDLVYRGHKSFCLAIIEGVLPVTCRTLGGKVYKDGEPSDVEDRSVGQ